MLSPLPPCRLSQSRQYTQASVVGCRLRRLHTHLQAFISGCCLHPPAICLLNLSIFPCLSPKPIAYLFISVYWQTSVFVCHPPDRVTLISARDNTPKGIIGEYVYFVESRLQPLSFSLSNYCLAADGKSRLLLLTMILILPRLLTISTPSSGYPFACRRQLLAAVGCCLFPVGVCFPLQAMCLLIWLSSVACYPGVACLFVGRHLFLFVFMWSSRGFNHCLSNPLLPYRWDKMGVA